MTKTEKALAAAISEICELNRELRILKKEFKKMAIELAEAKAKIPAKNIMSPEHPNCRCSLDPFAERSAIYETQ